MNEPTVVDGRPYVAVRCKACRGSGVVWQLRCEVCGHVVGDAEREALWNVASGEDPGCAPLTLECGHPFERLRQEWVCAVCGGAGEVLGVVEAGLRGDAGGHGVPPVQATGRPGVFAYIGRCPECGVVESIHIDLPDDKGATAEWVADMIRGGLVVSRDPEPAGGFRLGAPCGHRGEGRE